MDAKGIRDILQVMGVDPEEIKEHDAGERGRQIMCACPLAPWTHKDGMDANPSFTIKIAPADTSLFRCWSASCQNAGKLWWLCYLWWKHNGRDPDLAKWVDAIREMDQPTLEADIERTADLFRPKAFTAIKKRRDEDDDLDVFPETELDEFRKAGVPKAFFDRGFDKEDAKLWEIGWDAHMRRTVYPVRKRNGGLVGLSGRLVTKKKVPRRWFNYWHFHSRYYLYGEHLVPKDCTGIVLVEGQTDVIAVCRAIRLHGAGTDFEKFWSLGTIGDTLSAEQAAKLLALRVPVYQFPDNDDDGAGMAGARKSLKRLEGRTPVFWVPTPEGNDPGDFAKRPKRIIELLDQATVAGVPV